MVIKYSNGYNKDKIKYVGIYDFKETYKMLFEWLIDKGYLVDETSYKEVLSANGAKEIEVWWTATKDQSDYFQYEIKIFFHPIGMTNVEVEVEGIKQKMNKGELTIEFEWAINKDYKNRFTNNTFTKNLRDYYDKYLVSSRIEEQESLIIRDFEEMFAVLKDYIALTGVRNPIAT